MRRLFLSLVLMAFTLLPAVGMGYGPNVISDFGVVTWSLPIILDEDADTTKECPSGTAKSSVSVSSLLQDAVDIWSAAPQTNVSVTIDTSVLPAVDANNVCNFLFDLSACPDNGSNILGPSQGGTNPIVYDEDGSITALFFGEGNKFVTLGFAGVISFNNVASDSLRKALKGEGVINLACLAGCEEPGCLGFSFDKNTAVLGFVLHEIGHFFGMNHTQVNLVSDLAGSDPANTPTMWAIFTVAASPFIISLHRDDEVGMGNLYSNGKLESDFCTVTGTIRDGDGNEFQCANVVVHNTSSSKSKSDAMSFVSGGDMPGGTNEAGRGRFIIKGLTPGETYTLEVEPISTVNSLSSPSSGIIPCNGGAGNPSPPTFTAVTLSESIECTSSGSTLVSGHGTAALTVATGSTIDVGNVDLSNTSTNVASGIGSGSSGSGGGCSLIR